MADLKHYSLLRPVLLELKEIHQSAQLLKRIDFFAGEVESINLERKLVTVSHGFDHHHHELPYDHLVIGLGSITNFFNLPVLEQRALTMKSLGDAIHLRNRLIAHLEEADTECSAAVRRPLLTFVVAGGGFCRCRDHSRNKRFHSRGSSLLHKSS